MNPSFVMFGSDSGRLRIRYTVKAYMQGLNGLDPLSFERCVIIVPAYPNAI
jgi:hypothetical protein